MLAVFLEERTRAKSSNVVCSFQVAEEWERASSVCNCFDLRAVCGKRPAQHFPFAFFSLVSVSCVRVF